MPFRFLSRPFWHHHHQQSEPLILQLKSVELIAALVAKAAAIVIP
jgi:hypothetical protein